MHAAAIARELGDPGEVRCLDLGTGSGLPGLVMAICWPTTRWVLLDRRSSSEAFVTWAIGVLGLDERSGFRRGDAAELAREPDLAGAFALVVARSFGPPALTAECATGFMRIGSRLVVSEPEVAEPDRWPTGPLLELGLAVRTSGRAPRFVELAKVAEQGERHPRRLAAMRRNPLY
jgi:16S rRNA (guanine527-N7)-methyltransferase